EHPAPSPARDAGTARRVTFLRFLRRPKLARLRCMRIAHYVELMRDSQIKGLPRELITPVCLLMKETYVLHPGSPQHPRTRDAHEPAIILTKRLVGVLIHLTRPRNVFGTILPFAPVWSLSRHVLPA